MPSTQPCRRSLRLAGYDYSQPGAFLVTVCVHRRECLFGGISHGELIANQIGKAVIKCWNDLPGHFSHLALDYFTLMPNHIHGIIIIVGAGSPRPWVKPQDEALQKQVHPPRPAGFQDAGPRLKDPGGETPPLQKTATLGEIMGYFKYQSAKRINELRGTSGLPVWQRGYYEHVIRSEESLNRIREYIATNPLRWHLDRENPQAQGEDEFDLWLETFPAKTMGQLG